MKNEKICFNKSAGIIALVIVFLVGLAVAGATLTQKSTSTSTRASAATLTSKDKCIPKNVANQFADFEIEDPCPMQYQLSEQDCTYTETKRHGWKITLIEKEGKLCTPIDYNVFCADRFGKGSTMKASSGSCKDGTKPFYTTRNNSLNPQENGKLTCCVPEGNLVQKKYTANINITNTSEADTVEFATYFYPLFVDPYTKQIKKIKNTGSYSLEVSVYVQKDHENNPACFIHYYKNGTILEPATPQSGDCSQFIK